jgi:sec-independent protein translocase protein TatA
MFGDKLLCFDDGRRQGRKVVFAASSIYFVIKIISETSTLTIVAAEDVPMDYFSIWHWMIVIVVVMLLFGRHKVSDLMGDVAQGIKAFKKGMAEDEPAEAKSDATIHHQTNSGSTPMGPE